MSRNSIIFTFLLVAALLFLLFYNGYKNNSEVFLSESKKFLIKNATSIREIIEIGESSPSIQYVDPRMSSRGPQYGEFSGQDVRNFGWLKNESRRLKIRSITFERDGALKSVSFSLYSRGLAISGSGYGILFSIKEKTLVRAMGCIDLEEKNWYFCEYR